MFEDYIHMYSALLIHRHPSSIRAPRPRTLAWHSPMDDDKDIDKHLNEIHVREDVHTRKQTNRTMFLRREREILYLHSLWTFMCASKWKIIVRTLIYIDRWYVKIINKNITRKEEEFSLVNNRLDPTHWLREKHRPSERLRKDFSRIGQVPATNHGAWRKVGNLDWWFRVD